ncbi:MAG: hypothetical protein GY870_19755, partial [archaeon]|nr:hypothetical protein [archaeon]
RNQIQNKIFAINNSSGSEWDLFIDDISNRLNLSIFYITKEDLTESKIIENVDNFLKEPQFYDENAILEESLEEKEENLDEEEDEEVSKKKEKNQEKSLIDTPKFKLIIFNTSLLKSSKNLSVVQEFIEKLKQNTNNSDEILKPIPIVIIYNDENSIIPREIIQKTDISFTIPYPDKLNRLEIFEDLFNEMGVHTVDISMLTEITHRWNVKDLKRLVKAGFLKWKMVNLKEFQNMMDEKENVISSEEEKIEKKEIKPEEKKEENNIDKKEKVGNKNKNSDLVISLDLRKKLDYIIPFTVEIFKEIITKGQIKPLYNYPTKKIFEELNEKRKGLVSYSMLATVNGNNGRNSPNYKNNSSSSTIINSNPINNINEKDEIPLLRGINITEINSFTSSQLYQFAAANMFEELIKILEKLEQAKKLDEIDRKTLADFPFILKDDPKKAMIKLTNAKNRIDRIQKISTS